VPAATPIPRGPTVLTLYSAADLLTGPGCPICRYAGEASDRYLAWFALEGHADAVTVTRLCSSLGMCARHTRGLMSQPGAARRLTALGLRAADPWAGHVTASGAIERADRLIAELDQAFTNGTWAHRHQPQGPEMTAWRRAAAFLDGGVFCGCPPRGT
jgi:hypothetical protein